MKTKNETPRLTHQWKTAAAFAGILLVAGLIAGCVIQSIYPFYNSKDVTFDAALVGKWIPQEESGTNSSSEYWTFENVTNRTYKLTAFSDTETNHYDAVLFRLEGQTFLDCLPRMRGDYQTPNHILLRVESLQPRFKFTLLDYEWLGKLIEKEPRAIRHIIVSNEAGKDSGGGYLTLTADTAELQQFILKHLKTEQAWSKPLVMNRPEPGVSIPVK